jgi:hypothetical protein
MGKPLTREQADELLQGLRRYASVTVAAKALGIHRATLDSRVRAARRLLDTATHEIEDTVAAFEMADLPSELPTAAELLSRRAKQFARKQSAQESRRLIPVKVNIDGPIGIAHLGDPHVDDDGTDIDMLQRHVAIINKTEGLFAGNVGDYSNNWVGRLARLYGQQSTSAAEAWVLVEWLVRAVPWLYLVGGNHDLWSGSGDPIQWMAAQARVSYEAHGMRLGLTFPNGRIIRVNARHDFSGHSQWNTVHGPSKAAQMGWRDHILTCGHKHVSGYQVVRDPASGLLSHALRVGTYKIYDRYAEEKGLPNQNFMQAPVTIINPDEPDDSNRCVHVVFDPEEGADYLTWLRKRWKRKAA